MYQIFLQIQSWVQNQTVSDTEINQTSSFVARYWINMRE